MTFPSEWPNGVPVIGDEQRQRNLANLAKLRDLVATLWLYNGRYEETQLTTEQKELYADCVEACGSSDFNRWWRS